jgi:hypothetical protein
MSKLIDLSQMKEVCKEFLSIADEVSENKDFGNRWWELCERVVQDVLTGIEEMEEGDDA